jgi:subtilisin family serine protease
MPVETAVRVLNNLPGVEFAEPNWIATPQAISNDPLYLDGSLWGMYGDDLQDSVPSPIGPTGTTNPYGTQAEKAWDAGFIGSRDVYVGIIDGGIHYDHEDLAANIWTNPGEIPGNGIDDDGDGYADDVHGWNAADDNGEISKLDGTDLHPTHVAGTIGAVGGNGIGVVGVNWNVTMISGKMFGAGYYSDGIEAIDYMTALKTRKGLNLVALNHSWSGSGFSQALLDSISRAAQAGILSVCSAANNTNNNDVSPRYPASLDTTASAGYDAVVAVAAITRDGQLATYSNYGQTSVDLGAPGGQYFSATHIPDIEIISTVPTNDYSPMRGTSMAAPHVTGAVALYASVHPGSSPAQTRYDLLTSGTRQLEDLQGITVTGGTLDVGGLMTVPPNTLAAPSAPANVQAAVGVGGRVDLKWTDQSANELGFAIERSANGQSYVLVGTVGASLTNYSDWRVSANTTYAYRIRAYNPGGSSSYASVGNVTTPNVGVPTAPASLTASAQAPAKGGGIALAWADKSNNEGGFLVERKTGSTGAWQPLKTFAPNTTKYTDTTTVSRTKYTYRVRAYNIAGNSAGSNEVGVTAK